MLLCNLATEPCWATLGGVCIADICGCSVTTDHSQDEEDSHAEAMDFKLTERDTVPVWYLVGNNAWRVLIMSDPGFPILGVFRLKGQPNRDNGMIFGSCKATQSPVYPIRDAFLAVNHASCPSFSSSVPRQWGESALKTWRLPGALSPSWQDRGCTLPQLGAGDNRPIRSNTPSNNLRGTDISDN